MPNDTLAIRYAQALSGCFGFLRGNQNPSSNSASKARKEHAEKTQAQCPICGCLIRVKGSNEDHILPKNLGGSSRVDNLVLMCISCNLLRDQVQRVLFGGVGRKEARSVLAEDEERVKSYVLWLQVTVDEGVVAGAAYEEVRTANDFFIQIGGSNQPSQIIANTLGRYSEWAVPDGKAGVKISGEKPALKNLVIRSTDAKAKSKRSGFSSSMKVHTANEAMIRNGVIGILSNYLGTGQPISGRAFGTEFNRFIRESGIGNRKDVNESIGLNRSARIFDLVHHLFKQEEIEIKHIDAHHFLIQLSPSMTERSRFGLLRWVQGSWAKFIGWFSSRAKSTSARLSSEFAQEQRPESPEIQIEDVVTNDEGLSDFLGTDGDPIEKFLRSMSGQTIEISYLGDRLRSAFPSELGKPREWLKTQGHGLSKPFSQIISESYSHLIQDVIQRNSTILYVIADDSSNLAGNESDVAIPFFNSARGFTMPRDPRDVGRVLIALESLRGTEIKFSELVDHLIVRIEPRVQRLVSIVVRLRDYLGIGLEDTIDWTELPQPVDLSNDLAETFSTIWIPNGPFSDQIQLSNITTYFDQVRDSVQGQSYVQKEMADPKEWLVQTIIEIVNESNAEWSNQAWLGQVLINRIDKSAFSSRAELFEILGFKGTEKIRTVLEGTMGDSLEFDQVDPTYWRVRMR